MLRRWRISHGRAGNQNRGHRADVGDFVPMERLPAVCLERAKAHSTDCDLPGFPKSKSDDEIWSLTIRRTIQTDRPRRRHMVRADPWWFVVWLEKEAESVPGRETRSHSALHFIVFSNFRVFAIRFDLQFAESEITKRITKTRNWERQSWSKSGEVARTLANSRELWRTRANSGELARTLVNFFLTETWDIALKSL